MSVDDIRDPDPMVLCYYLMLREDTIDGNVLFDGPGPGRIVYTRRVVSTMERIPVVVDAPDQGGGQ